MDNEKLIYALVAIVVAVIAFPFVYPMFVDTSSYNAALDTQNMERMSKAIHSYATDNQQYPPSLHVLVPDYLADVPLTSTNLPFEYDPATGQIVNPSTPKADGEEQRAGNRGSRSGGGGISPATDAMTGLGVSEELNF